MEFAYDRRADAFGSAGYKYDAFNRFHNDSFILTRGSRAPRTATLPILRMPQ
jgi:hypothetical protein